MTEALQILKEILSQSGGAGVLTVSCVLVLMLYKKGVITFSANGHGRCPDPGCKDAIAEKMAVIPPIKADVEHIKEAMGAIQRRHEENSEKISTISSDVAFIRGKME